MCNSIVELQCHFSFCFSFSLFGNASRREVGGKSFRSRKFILLHDLSPARAELSALEHKSSDLPWTPFGDCPLPCTAIKRKRSTSRETNTRLQRLQACARLFCTRQRNLQHSLESINCLLLSSYDLPYKFSF